MKQCVLPCCSYYGHLSQRFCNINRTYQELFEQCFSKQYALIHRLETNKLRNVARLFAVWPQALLTNCCFVEPRSCTSLRMY